MRTRPASRPCLRALLLTVSCAALLSSGCATIANGRHQRLRVETNPPAAKVSVQGTQRQIKGGPLQFETPGEIILSRKEKHVVLRIEKDGYEPAEVALQRSLGAWTPAGGASFLGLGVLTGRGSDGGGAASGLALGGVLLVVSVGIDLMTGSAYRLDPSKVSLTLQPITGPSAPTEASRAKPSSFPVS